MSSNDPSKRTEPRRERRSSASNQPERQSPGGQLGAAEGAAPGTGASSRRRLRSGDADFGSFVSSSARSSGDLFKTGGSRRSAARPTSAPGSPASPQSDQVRTSESQEPEPRADRPRRYWRDAVAQSGEAATPRTATSERTQASSAAPARGIRIPGRDREGGGGIRFMPRDREGRGGFLPGGTLPSRTLLGILGGVILLISLLVFALNQGGEDAGDDSLTPTSTVQSVLNPAEGTDAGAPSSPGSGESTEPATEPPANAAPQATEDGNRPRQGGDNQLSPPDDATETPAASSSGPPARKSALHGIQRS